MTALLVALIILAYWLIGVFVFAFCVKCLSEEPDDFLLMLCVSLWPLVVCFGVFIGLLAVTGKMAELITGVPVHFIGWR